MRGELAGLRLGAGPPSLSSLPVPPLFLVRRRCEPGEENEYPPTPTVEASCSSTTCFRSCSIVVVIDASSAFRLLSSVLSKITAEAVSNSASFSACAAASAAIATSSAEGGGGKTCASFSCRSRVLICNCIEYTCSLKSRSRSEGRECDWLRRPDKASLCSSGLPSTSCVTNCLMIFKAATLSGLGITSMSRNSATSRRFRLSDPPSPRRDPCSKMRVHLAFSDVQPTAFENSHPNNAGSREEWASGRSSRSRDSRPF
mmetsp:Transcript_33966/g.77619  ORF Transcript_33966/g.77619 Transcript_33966/m.77619 type:complete len:258 (+) Transcript_33966:534-1307(+)